MARTAVTDETIDYPDSDGLPMAENESQFWPILYVGAALDHHFQVHDDVYVVGNLLLYYQEGNPREGDFGKSVSPDLMVVLGAPKHVRSSYRLWEEPKAPDFVLEIASESTYRVDQVSKRAIYAGIGVSEYWQVDPVGSYLRPPLQGFRLVGGRYESIPHAEGVDGTLRAGSAVLGLELRLNPAAPLRDVFRLYDPVRGEPLRSLREAEQEREEAEARREHAEAQLGQTEGRLRQTQDRLQESEAARQALEAELRALRRASGRESADRGEDGGEEGT